MFSKKRAFIWSVTFMYFADVEDHKALEGDPATLDGPHLFRSSKKAYAFLEQRLQEFMEEDRLDPECSVENKEIYFDKQGRFRHRAYDTRFTFIKFNVGKHLKRKMQYIIEEIEM